MEEPILKSAQTQNTSQGQLQINVTANVGLLPIQDAKITISFTGEPNSTVETLTTDSSGQTQSVDLEAPPLEYSLTPESPMPYSEYTLQVTAPGYEPVIVSGVEVLPDVTAVQNIEMIPTETAQEENEIITIPDHTLYGEYPPKIPEDEIKPIDESGEIVLSRVVIPEFIIVHDGAPGDSTAANYYVRYRDYIKNVVSSEIYATWPESAIYANTLAIMSFTLNRVYTEWYRNQESFGRKSLSPRLNDLEGFPLPRFLSSYKNDCPDYPLTYHGDGDSHYAQLQRNAKHIRKYQSYGNRCKDGNIHGKFHIPRCPQSIAECPGKGKYKGIKYIVE